MPEKVFRCAVYTRKSTEDGLEQEFNSLDAQYEACAAYALSQRHEGWVLGREHYDDGFQHAGWSWRSLSEIARHVTGAHWSGPRFFGLTGRG